VTKTAASPPWRSRIVGHGEAAPADLVPNPRNWRTHPSDQQAALSGALAEVGWVAEVTVHKTTGHVVDGHLRIELALARKEPTVPVTYVELSEDEERLVLASLDPLAALAEAEATKLAELLEGLDPGDAALRALLDDLARENDLESLRRGLVDPDDVPDLPEPADCFVQPGELWQLGDHRLLCGDANDPAAVARLLDGAAPTLLATDPPYGVSLDGSWRDGVYNGLGPAEPAYMQVDGQPGAKNATRANGRRRGRNTTISGDTRVDWSAAFELVPSLQAGYVWHADRHAPEVALAFSADGLHWQREGPDALFDDSGVAAISWTGQGYAAVGSHQSAQPSGVISQMPGQAAAWWSSDGRDWHPSDVGSGAYEIGSVQPWVDGLRAVGAPPCPGCISAPAEWRSSDGGRTWHELPLSPTTDYPGLEGLLVGQRLVSLQVAARESDVVGRRADLD
jgi:hypothetical protein